MGIDLPRKESWRKKTDIFVGRRNWVKSFINLGVCVCVFSVQIKERLLYTFASRLKDMTKGDYVWMTGAVKQLLSGAKEAPCAQELSDAG